MPEALVIKIAALASYLPIATSLALMVFGAKKLRERSTRRAWLHVAALALFVAATFIAWLTPILLGGDVTSYTPYSTPRLMVALNAPRAIRDVALSLVLVLLTLAIFDEDNAPIGRGRGR